MTAPTLIAPPPTTPAPDGTQPPAPATAVRAAVRHAGLLLGLALALLVPAKLLRVSHGDLPTALAVLNASDKTTIVTGLVLLSLPVLLAVCWITVAAFAGAELGVLRNTATAPDRASRALALLAVVAVPAGPILWLLLAVCPWPITAVALGSSIPFGWWEHHRTRRPQRTGSGRLMRAVTAERPTVRAGLAVVAVTVLFALLVADVVLSGPLDDTVWLPPEKITTTAGSSAVGYVLSRDDTALVVLMDRDRRIERMPAATIRSERVCRKPLIGDGRSAWDVSNRRPRPAIPKC